MKTQLQPIEAQTDYVRTNRVTPKSFRPLKWNELVNSGDFVMDEAGNYQLWEGPAGFQAGSFVSQIYRRAGRGSSLE